MSAVCVLTPLVITSWPLISAAVVGAAASMGFAVKAENLHEDSNSRRRSVETEIDESEIVADGTAPGQRITVQRGDITISVGQDERGRCTVCVDGSCSERELHKIGEEVAGRIVQQFAYHKLLSELKERDATVLSEEVLADESVRVRVRL
jgi:hypothetical protein